MLLVQEKKKRVVEGARKLVEQKLQGKSIATKQNRQDKYLCCVDSLCTK